MPVVIGAKPQADFSNPIGVLHDCHRRIERFLSVLIRVTEAAGGRALNDEQRVAMNTALRYFREAAPKHTRDEEDSVFPRLRAMEREEVKPVIGRVDALENDHSRLDADHAEVDRLGQAWLDAGTLPQADAARLAELLAGMARIYEQHIAIEEREVFPVATMVLGEPDRKSIGNEMAKRRGLHGSL